MILDDRAREIVAGTFSDSVPIPTTLHLSCGDGSWRNLFELLSDHPSLAALPDAERAHAVLGHLVLFEMDRGKAKKQSADLKDWLTSQGVAETLPVNHLAQVAALTRSNQRDLFRDLPQLDHQYDLVVCDVPFFPLDSETRDLVRANAEWTTGRFSSETLFVSALWSMMAEEGICVMRIREQFFRRVYGAELLRKFYGQLSVIDVRRVDGRIDLILMRSDRGDSLDNIRTLGDADGAKTLAVIEGRDRLESFLSSFPGEAFRTEPFALYDAAFLGLSADRAHVRQVATAERVHRWSVQPELVFWPYDKEGSAIDVLPVEVEAAFEPHMDYLTRRTMFGLDMTQRGRAWFEFVAMYPERESASPTIVFTTHHGSPHCAVVETPMPATQGAINLLPSDPDHAYWLCGLLNSSLATFWMQQTFAMSDHPDLGVTSLEPTASQLREFPIATDYRAEIDGISRSIHDVGESLYRVPDGLLFDDWRQGVEDAAARMEKLEADLDRWVAKAYGLEAETFEPPARIDHASVMANAIEASLRLAVQTLIERTRIPSDRPFSIAEVELELRRDAAWSALLDASRVPIAQILLGQSVPDDPSLISNTPRPASVSDFLGYRSTYPLSSKRESRRRLSALRGTIGLRRERFVHLVSWSEALHHPIFSCAPLREVASSDTIQFDLGRIAEMETTIGDEISISDLIVLFGRLGWSLAEIRSSLLLLAEQGNVEIEGTMVRRVD